VVPTAIAVDDSALHEFRFAIRKFLAFSEQAARSAHLDPQQHQLMLAIRARGGPEGLNISEAAERMLLRHHTMVELVDRAIRNQLVSRSRDQHDRRVVRLRLTPHGEQVLDELSAHHVRELETAGPVLVQALETVLGTRL
jgi:DNA-binding MarR family transcriptional regulator